MRKCWVQLLSCEVWWKKLLIFFLGINRYLGNHSDFNWQTAGPRPHVSFLIWKRRFFFFNGLKYRPHVSGENGHGKRIFSKTLFGVEILENAENGGFRIRRCRSSSTTSITQTLWGMLSCFHRFEHTTTTCEFFRKRRGKSPFSKIIRILVDGGLRIQHLCPLPCRPSYWISLNQSIPEQ